MSGEQSREAEPTLDNPSCIPFPNNQALLHPRLSSAPAAWLWLHAHAAAARVPWPAAVSWPVSATAARPGHDDAPAVCRPRRLPCTCGWTAADGGERTWCWPRARWWAWQSRSRCGCFGTRRSHGSQCVFGYPQVRRRLECHFLSPSRPLPLPPRPFVSLLSHPCRGGWSRGMDTMDSLQPPNAE
jgi:hypothetical protein